MAVLFPAIVARLSAAPTSRFSDWNVPVCEAKMNFPAAVPAAHVPLVRTTRVMTAVAADVAPVIVLPSTISVTPPEVKDNCRPSATAVQPVELDFHSPAAVPPALLRNA